MKHDWKQWIDRMKETGATEQDAHELDRALREDPAHPEEYLKALMEEVALESDGLPRPVPSVVPFRPRTSSRAILAWAAALVAIGTASFFLGRGSSTPGEAPSLATITDTDEAAESVGIRIGALLGQGGLEVPENSEVGIAMRGGARLEVKGPASLSIESAERILLRTGRIETYAPDYAHGFIVDTSDGRLVDLGTRFVTAAGGGRGTEVHVLEGLVRAEPGDSEPSQDIPGEEAAILKGGKLTPTDFLARRLEVPLDPTLPDGDGDGFPDALEIQYGSDPLSADSEPEALRWEATFENRESYQATWSGEGRWLPDGLSYSNGTKLRSTAGAFETSGMWFAGARHLVADDLLPKEGVSYISFLMRMPDYRQSDRPYGGLTFYEEDEERLFVGKIAPRATLGVRVWPGQPEFFGVAPGGETHLFVIRIDRTRLVTDVFLDPVPGEKEEVHKPSHRLHDVPVFDRVAMRSGSTAMRSGSTGDAVPAVFDEIRFGLTWESVVPVAQ